MPVLGTILFTDILSVTFLDASRKPSLPSSQKKQTNGPISPKKSDSKSKKPLESTSKGTPKKQTSKDKEAEVLVKKVTKEMKKVKD